MISARTNFKSLLLERPTIRSSLCKTVNTVRVPDSNKKIEIASKVTLSENYGLYTTDMYESDYPRALYFNLGLEPSYGFGLTPDEAQLMN